jgi:protein TonB
MLIRFAVLLPIAGLVYEARHAMLSVRPLGPDAQRVTLLDQPKREVAKPPEPEVKPPETEPVPTETKQPFMKFDDSAAASDPGPDRAGDKGPPPPSSDTLGLDAKGGPGSDAFGLASKRGGRDITTLGSDGQNGTSSGPGGHGQGEPMAKFAGYAFRLRDSVTARLNARAELRVANYDAVIEIWIDPDGGIKRVALAKSTGIARIDEAIRQTVQRLPKLTLPTPPDMPQPVDLRIVSKGASGYDNKPEKTN